jgi:pilus assembly protein Flp/PilA
MSLRTGTLMNAIKQNISRLLRDEEGATAVEYAIMVALIAAVIIIVVKVVGTKSNNAFESVNSTMP